MKIENVVGALALAISDDVLAAARADEPEAAAIALIGHVPGLSIDRLRRALGLSHPGAVRLVDRLAAAGLATRFRAGPDRRAVTLALTDAGAARCRALLARRQGVLARALATVSEDDRQALGRIAEALLGVLPVGITDACRICRLCDPAACVDCPVEASGPVSGDGGYAAMA